MIHELKTHPGAFRSVLRGDKRAEFRLNDRNFQVGDLLLLQEWDPAEGTYTGDEYTCLVTRMVNGPSFGIPLNYTMMSIEGKP